MMAGSDPAVAFVHATGVVVGEQGVLIEGASGSGKSSLAAALLRDAEARHLFARLVGDDRVGLVACHGRLIAQPHPTVAGLLEVRGVGLVRVAHQPAAVLHLSVRLTSDSEGAPRLPDRCRQHELLGIGLPLLVIPASVGPVVAAGLVWDHLVRIRDERSLQPLQSAC